jgi:hypothetical protein
MASAEGLVFGPGPDAKGHAKLSAKAVADVLRRNAFERTTVLSKHFATLCETTHAAGRLCESLVKCSLAAHRTTVTRDAAGSAPSLRDIESTLKPCDMLSEQFDNVGFLPLPFFSVPLLPPPPRAAPRAAPAPIIYVRAITLNSSMNLPPKTSPSQFTRAEKSSKSI